MVGGCIDVLATMKNKGNGGDDKGMPDGEKRAKVLRWILIGLGIFGFSIIVIVFFSLIIIKRDKSITSKSLLSAAFSSGQSINIEHGDNFGYTPGQLISQRSAFEQDLANPDEKNKKINSSQYFGNVEAQKNLANNAKAALLMTIQKDLEDALSAQLEQIKKNNERISELENQNALLERFDKKDKQEILNAALASLQMKKEDSRVFELKEKIKKNEERLSELEETNTKLEQKKNKYAEMILEARNIMRATGVEVRRDISLFKARHGITPSNDSSDDDSSDDVLSGDVLSGDDSSDDDSSDDDSSDDDSSDVDLK